MSYDLKEVCKDIRCDIMTCIGHLGVGHIGGCLSVVEALAVLYFKEMNIDPANPKMEGRDRFICSKGHALDTVAVPPPPYKRPVTAVRILEL